MAERWQIGSTWRFTGLVLTTEKTAYIHTTCRIAVDLRKAKVDKLLQSIAFPVSPVPTVIIADVFKLKVQQRFDIMAVVAQVSEARKSAQDMHIADILLVDGSKEDASNTTEYASLPLTLFSKMRKN